VAHKFTVLSGGSAHKKISGGRRIAISCVGALLFIGCCPPQTLMKVLLQPDWLVLSPAFLRMDLCLLSTLNFSSCMNWGPGLWTPEYICMRHWIRGYSMGYGQGTAMHLVRWSNQEHEIRSHFPLHRIMRVLRCGM
jgi:hypothetical protein